MLVLTKPDYLLLTDNKQKILSDGWFKKLSSKGCNENED